ncbi:protein phosphatase 2C domain-containing protein [Ruminococcus sp.]|uniref:PP2C family protein-serine/threonine phosphatase n=1 Tax=Ruminococcus sp. TaxID=41978 RepID=UPI0025E7DADF|nr:protein phosphatase 2C domain-containing protein [Ruminococcus sp.]
MFFNHKNTDQNQNHNPFFYYGGNYPGETSEPFYHTGVTEYQLRVSVSTHIGKVRGNHEDNFYLEGLYMNDIFRNDFSATYTIRHADGMSFAVFDGMGGAAYGEVASEIAVQTLRKYEKKLKYADGTRMLDQLISSYTTEANNAVCAMLTEKHCLSGGTTFSMLYFLGDAVKLYYLGDSRIYRYKQDGLTRLTRDHTVANQKVDAAIYTEEEAKRSPDQHRLTLFIGSDRNKAGLNADSRPPIPLEVGSKFVLCTDGLTNMCNDDEIFELLSQNYFNEAAVLVQAALQNGGSDNVTCIVLEILPATPEEDA